jgi:NAD(P)H-hydrate epimerase
MTYLESEAYRDGSSPVDFMEEAGSGVALVAHEFVERYGLSRNIILLCGKGNNAGDAYVAGIHLLHLEYSVHALQVHPLLDTSELTQKNAERFLNEGGHIKEIKTEEDIEFPESGLILDGLFGTGFKGEVKDPYAFVINAANDSGLIIIGIDIPSGLNGETGEASTPTIVATQTATLGLPKTGFFLRDGWDHVGALQFIDFGLPAEYIEEIEPDFELLTADMLIPLMPEMNRTRHKYEAGLVVGIGGPMQGASLLSSIAALRSGAGIVKLYVPDSVEYSALPLEIIHIPLDPKNLKSLLRDINKAGCCFIGPGLGTSPDARKLLKSILPEIEVPTVLDADALNIISETPLPLPPKTILTPHRGELERLLKLPKEQKVTLDFLKVCQAYAEELQVTLVMKGAPTFIFHPNKTIHVNSTGDPGMATAGAGDVLTGLIAGLLAQKLQPEDAAYLGTFLHGLAGEHASQEKTPYCMIASDLLEYFPAAFAFETA